MLWIESARTLRIHVFITATSEVAVKASVPVDSRGSVTLGKVTECELHRQVFFPH
jgi:hypothetical protein